MIFRPLPQDGRIIAGTWYPSTWPMWLARYDNLPLGCLTPHLGRLLSVIPAHYTPVVTLSGAAAVQTRQISSSTLLPQGRSGMAATALEGTAPKLVTGKCGRTMPNSEDRGDSRKDGTNSRCAATEAPGHVSGSSCGSAAPVVQQQRGLSRPAGVKSADRGRQVLTIWFWAFALGCCGVCAWMLIKVLTE